MTAVTLCRDRQWRGASHVPCQKMCPIKCSLIYCCASASRSSLTNLLTWQTGAIANGFGWFKVKKVPHAFTSERERYVWQQHSHSYGCSGCNHRRLWWALQVYYTILQSVCTVLSIKQALSKAVKTFPCNSTSDKGCKSHRRNRTSVLFVSYDWMRLKLFTDLIPYANMCEPSPVKVLQWFMDPLPEITSSWIHITRITKKPLDLEFLADLTAKLNMVCRVTTAHTYLHSCGETHLFHVHIWLGLLLKESDFSETHSCQLTRVTTISIRRHFSSTNLYIILQQPQQWCPVFPHTISRTFSSIPRCSQASWET